METIFQSSGVGAKAPPPAAPALTLTERMLVRRTLAAALVLGAVGDGLLREGPGGMGFTLFTLATLRAPPLASRAPRLGGVAPAMGGRRRAVDAGSVPAARPHAVLRLGLPVAGFGGAQVLQL